MWKSGQIITIRGKKYRVKSTPGWYFPCNRCALGCDTDANCYPICLSEDSKLNGSQYLEEILAKGKVL